LISEQLCLGLPFCNTPWAIILTFDEALAAYWFMQAAQAGLDEAQYQISRMLRHVLMRWWIVNWSQCAKRNRYNCFGYYLVNMIGYFGQFKI